MTSCDLDLDLPAVNSCEQMLEPELKLFKEAARRGVHRTVHAGEAGPACMVQIVSKSVYWRGMRGGYGGDSSGRSSLEL